MFKSMDTDNSGAITFDELKAGLKRFGSTLKDTEIRDLMDAVRPVYTRCCRITVIFEGGHFNHKCLFNMLDLGISYL